MLQGMAGESLWDLTKKWEGIDPATELPVTLDARRDHADGLTHCARCGGKYFTGTVVFDQAGQPTQVLTPQTCIGCGALRQANWPS